ncbi:MAG: SDR family oxidoreductase [Bacteroidota bacterium]
MATLVVGAGKGIGWEVVKRILSEYPDEKVIAVSRNIKNLLSLQKEYPALWVFTCDISSEKDLKKLQQEISKMKIKVRYLINLAGVLVKKQWKHLNSKDFDQIYHTNVLGAFNLVKLLYPSLAKNQKAHIVNIGSMGGVEGTMKFPGMIFYSSSKAALSTLTECLAEELKSIDIHCNCISLGAVETSMKKKAFPDFKAPHNPTQVAEYLVSFLYHQRGFFNGKVIKLSVSVP